jgi:hypothetical protein
MEPISIISLIIAGILAIERMFKRVKKCNSGCCSAEMATEPISPKNIEISKI